MTVTPEVELRFIDKSDWGDGPWQDEPDKVQWTDEATGLPCLAVRHPHSGHWCGYVGVAEGHPVFGLEYDEANKLGPTHLYEDEDDSWVGFDVHGGLTFSDSCQEDEQEQGVCHIPQPGQPDKVWWLGFDCAHSQDIRPTYLRRYGKMFSSSVFEETYKTLEYVQNECANLAQQLKEVQP